MSEHTIYIRLQGKNAVPEPRNQTLTLGDTVRYVTDPPNRALVTFGASPFSDKPRLTIQDSEPLKVLRRGRGHFRSKCFIVTPEGKKIGWAENNPESGGEHDVRP